MWLLRYSVDRRVQITSVHGPLWGVTVLMTLPPRYENMSDVALAALQMRTQASR